MDGINSQRPKVIYPQVIALDIDGVVADTILRWLDAYNNDYGTEYTKKDVTDWDLMKSFDVTNEALHNYFTTAWTNWPKNIWEALFAGRSAILYGQLWNRSGEDAYLGRRAHSLTEVRGFVDEISHMRKIEQSR
tara:strand:+ start:4102 stop:4503 length:402 start_codon:yes stop_codon:yes gene_type:complete